MLLSLVGFFIVGIMALNSDEELIWAVGKAVGAFVVCWIAFGYLGGMLFAIVDSQKTEEDSLDSEGKEPSDVKRG